MELPVIHQPADNYRWVERTICGALQDIRELLKPHIDGKECVTNVGILLAILSLVNEIQIYASRMEAALGDVREFKNRRDEYKELLEKIKTLKKENNITDENPHSASIL